MAGPWNEPVDMGIGGFIDPGHVVGEDGRRYLFLNAGHRVRISDDGLSRAGPIEKVYDGWRLHPYRTGDEQRFPPAPAIQARRLVIRVVDDENVATFSYSEDGSHWTKAASFEVAGYNQNIGG